MDSRTGQDGRGGGSLEKLPHQPRAGGLPAFCLAWRCDELPSTDWCRPPSVALVGSVGQPPAGPHGRGPLVLSGSLGGWGSSGLWAHVFASRWLVAAQRGVLALWRPLCVSPQAPSGFLPAWRPRSEAQRPGGGCGPFMTSAAFSGRSLQEERQRIWAHV